jgi:hypothetical protein
MKKSGFFTKIIFAVLLFEVSAWLSNLAMCKIGLIEFSGTFLIFGAIPACLTSKFSQNVLIKAQKGCFSLNLCTFWSQK